MQFLATGKGGEILIYTISKVTTAAAVVGVVVANVTINNMVLRRGP